MNEYLKVFHDINQSVEHILIDERSSPEMQQSATNLKNSVQPCLEELKRSAARLKELVQISIDELEYAEDVWNSKPRIAEAAKHEVWEQLGDLSGLDIRIIELAVQCRNQAIKKNRKYWEERIKFIQQKWFTDNKGQLKKGIGWSEKENFIKGMYSKTYYQIEEINKLIKDELGLIHKEIKYINLDVIKKNISLLDRQKQAEYNQQIEDIAIEIDTKFSNITEHLPNYLVELKTAITPDLKTLVDNGWGDILWVDVVKFKNTVDSKTEKFINAIFDDRVKLATQALEQIIAFYNGFLERQERYQQETPEQREAEKAWIEQQRQQLEQVQQGIEAILNAS